MQRFTFILDDPSYDLRIKQTITIKPNDFYIHAIPRTDKKRSIIPVPVPSSTLLQPSSEARQVPAVDSAPSEEGKTPLYVLYGSNTGTCESFAQSIASGASAHGK